MLSKLRESQLAFAIHAHRGAEKRMGLLQRYCDDLTRGAHASSELVTSFFWPSAGVGDGSVRGAQA